MIQNPRFAPVPIALGRLGTTRMVTSAREAAECLLSEDWPALRGEAARNARETLLAALEGNASGDEARAAFERAAQAAGIIRANLRGR